MNGQIVLYMECYLPICSNSFSCFIVQTGATVEEGCHIDSFLCYATIGAGYRN